MSYFRKQESADYEKLSRKFLAMVNLSFLKSREAPHHASTDLLHFYIEGKHYKITIGEVCKFFGFVRYYEIF